MTYGVTMSLPACIRHPKEGSRLQLQDPGVLASRRLGDARNEQADECRARRQFVGAF
jgi:hypothetical protein